MDSPTFSFLIQGHKQSTVLDSDLSLVPRLHLDTSFHIKHLMQVSSNHLLESHVQTLITPYFCYCSICFICLDECSFVLLMSIEISTAKISFYSFHPSYPLFLHQHALVFTLKHSLVISTFKAILHLTLLTLSNCICLLTGESAPTSHSVTTAS